MKKNKSKFSFWFLAVLAATMVVVAACGTVAPVEVVSSATYTLTNSDGVVATISWDGANWSCTTVPAIEGSPCAQMLGSQYMFFYGTDKIAKEKLLGGVQVGSLIPQSNWK
ncbi:hypothetical protein KA111_00220 [Candidatus Woesebacteria bacterium]|nr:hypothetical protein [Candidatus Woesebacteria bacterium]